MSETNNQTPAPTPTPTPDPAAAPPPPGSQSAEPAGDAKPAPSPAGDLLDTKPSDDAKPQAAGDLLSDDGNAKPEGVPDQYTFEPPEGVAIDEAKLDAFKEKAKEYGLSQDQFQNLLQYDIERTQAAETEAVEAWNTRVEGWREAARTDKDIGGENFNANVQTALQAVEKFGDAEFKALLKSPSEDNPDGLAIGNHPAVLRFLNRIGKMLGDPNLVQGEAQTKSDTTEAKLKRLYPSMFKESA